MQRRDVTRSLHRGRIVVEMRSRITVLVGADEGADCGGVLAPLSDSSMFDLIGPIPVLDALRFCSRRVPPIVLVHASLRDLRAAEFCLLLRGRARERAYSALLFGAARSGLRNASPAEVALADGYISRTGR